MPLRAIALVALLLACVRPLPTPSTPPQLAPTADAGARDAAVVAAPERRDAVATLAALSPEPFDAASSPWVPALAMRAMLQTSTDLPTPGAPRSHGDRVTWELLLGGRGLAAGDGVCAAVRTAEPRVACACDEVEHAGRRRTRVVLLWREAAGPAPISRVQPLRALARLARRVCLLSVQRTAETLDLDLRADDERALGETLALLTVSPGLHALITVRVEPAATGLRATLSGPVTRATDDGLGDDPWPQRCEGTSDVGVGALRGTLPVARSWVPGARAQGAVLTAGRLAWVVTVGDRVANAEVRRIDATGVTLRLPGVAREVRRGWTP